MAGDVQSRLKADSLGCRFLLLHVFFIAAVATADQPDLSGTYDVGTLTPLQRPQAFGNNLYLTPEQAGKMASRVAAMLDNDARASDPDRGAPPKGKFTNGYNLFWVDFGSTAISLDGRFRTSLITSPADGRIPQMTRQGVERMAGLLSSWQIVWRNPDPTTSKNGSTAWWFDDGSPDGPYDHMEQRPLAERCVIGSRSTAGPPMLPNVYNNHKRIVQTKDAVVILTEMNHDARVIRMNATHRPGHIKTWLGDSIGRWEGDVLVVDTTNFKSTPALSGADENLHVVEHLRRIDAQTLLYSFQIEDPTVWSSAWGGEYPWRASTGKVYEFACHEGNYAMPNVMSGARTLEKARLSKTSS